jgi:cytochrome c-type biogenesis protein CcmH/NrfG
MKTAFVTTILTLALAAGSAFAAGTPDPVPAPEPKPKDAILERFDLAKARQDWPAAAAALKEGVASQPGNAEYHNLYAYATRKGANPDMSLVFKHYNEALRIDPKHRGAHEYLGEAYLMVGNVAKAKEHLAVLDRLCTFGCSEFTDLKKAIASFESKTASR